MTYWQIKITKLAALATAIVTLILFLSPSAEEWTFDWGHFWAALTATAVFVLSEWRESMRIMRLTRINSVISDHDVELINSFCELLPSDGSTMRFLKDHDLGNPFAQKVLSSAEIFEEQWGDPERRFLDQDLEMAKEKLRNHVDEFFSELAPNVGAEVGGGRLSVIPSEHLGGIDIPKRFREAARQLNILASGVVQHHEAFVTLSRAKVSEREKAMLMKSSGLV